MFPQAPDHEWGDPGHREVGEQAGVVNGIRGRKPRGHRQGGHHEGAGSREGR